MAVEPSGAKGVAMMINVPWVLNIPMNMGEGASSKTRVYNVYTFLSKHVGEHDDKPRDSRFSVQCIVWTWVVVSKCVENIPSPDSSRFIDITMNEGIPFGDNHTTSMAQMVDEIIRYQANMDSLGRFGRPGFHDEKCSLLCVKKKIDNANIERPAEGIIIDFEWSHP